MSERNPKIPRLDEPSSPRNMSDSIIRSSPDNFMVILEDITIDYILRHLPAKDLLKCCCVSKEWNEKVSQFKSIWKKLCRKYGLLYTDPTGASIESCKQFFAKFAGRVVHMKLSLCFRMKKIHNNVLRNITAMHSNGENIVFMSRSENIRIYHIHKSRLYDQPIQTTDINWGQCQREEVFAIRIDSHKLVVATESGKVRSLSIPSGQQMGWRNFHRKVYSFDLLERSDLIACGFRKSVKICNIGGVGDRETLTRNNGPIVRILLAWEEPYLGDGNYGRILLFFMDIENLYIRRFLMRSLGENLSISYMDELTRFQLDQPGDEMYNDGFLLSSLCYDDHVLYFPATNSKGIGHELGRYDVTNRQKLDNVHLDGAIKFLLGVGKMNIAVITGMRDDWIFNFQAFDKTTFELRATFEIGRGTTSFFYLEMNNSLFQPVHIDEVPEGRYNVRYDFACIAKTQWLNGVNENTDWGPIFCLNDGSRYIKMLWWTLRI